MLDEVAVDNNSTLSIVIPAYNEAENIGELYSELTSVLDKMGREYEVIFVDDGSTDGSFGVLSDMCKRSKHLKVIRLRRNSGQSAALSAGFDHATGDYIITLDADLQNDPADIPRLIEAMGEDYDVVCGWRASRKDNFSKNFFSMISNVLRKSMAGESIHDSGCTLRIYKKECVNDLELYGEMHRYIPALMSINGYRVGEIKVNHRERRHGKSKYNWKRIVKGFSDLLVVVFWSKFSMRPMHVFGTTGISMGSFGVVVSAYLIIEKLLFNLRLSDRPLFILSLLSMVIGLQFIAFGVLADISLKTYYGQRKFKNYRIAKILESHK